MPQKKKLVTQIRKDSTGRGTSTGFIKPTSNPLQFCPQNNQTHPQKPIQTQSQPNSQTKPIGQTEAQAHNHLQIQIQVPPTSPPPPPPPPRQATRQPPVHSFQDDQAICNNPSKKTQKRPLFSTPHKRPAIMIQSPPSSLSHSPTLSSLHSLRQSNFSAKPPNLSDTVSFATPLKTLAHKLLFHLRHARLLCVHLRVLVLVFLPSLYFFLFNPRRLLMFGLLFFLSFSITLIIFPNLALPRLPFIPLFRARSLPIKTTQPPRISTKDSKPVIWSIGSKPKVEKKPISGSWVQVYSNGDVYEGEFHKGKCSGSGVYYYNMSGRYEGDWIDEKYDGHGVETWAKGSRYRGQYSQGLRHGIGVYRFYTGDVYSGEWSNGQCHGCGIHTCEDGSKYVGEFKWGVKHGLGHYHFRNGDTYAGEYFADRMHGFGVYKFGNGHLYEGAWHEGRRQGLGMYTFRNGETQSGHWKNGFLEVASKENSNPGSSSAISHIKVLNAVQEAQQAAEKVYNVAKVEERVNKAVAVANRAANAARVAAVKAVQNRMYHNNDSDLPPLSIQR